MKTMIPIPAGSLLTISSGSYSDYFVRGVFRALKEIDADRLLAEWLTAHPEQRKTYRFKSEAFQEWVVRRGFLECLDTYEWYLCDDGRSPDEMDVEAPDPHETGGPKS